MLFISLSTSPSSECTTLPCTSALVCVVQLTIHRLGGFPGTKLASTVRSAFPRCRRASSTLSPSHPALPTLSWSSTSRGWATGPTNCATLPSRSSRLCRRMPSVNGLQLLLACSSNTSELCVAWRCVLVVVMVVVCVCARVLAWRGFGSRAHRVRYATGP